MGKKKGRCPVPIGSLISLARLRGRYIPEDGNFHNYSCVNLKSFNKSIDYTELVQLYLFHKETFKSKALALKSRQNKLLYETAVSENFLL
jgi:hypothetical protein